MQSLSSLTQLTSLPEYKNGTIILHFWAEWSKPSAHISTILDALAKQNAGKAAFVKVGKKGEIVSSHL